MGGRGEGKKDELAVFVRDVKKYYGIAEKILEGLLESGFLTEEYAKEECTEKYSIPIIKFPIIRPRDLVIDAIARAMVKNLTYGNLGTMTLRNNKGRIVAKLYILPDGTLAEDSWLCNEGWK